MATGLPRDNFTGDDIRRPNRFATWKPQRQPPLRKYFQRNLDEIKNEFDRSLVKMEYQVSTPGNLGLDGIPKRVRLSSSRTKKTKTILDWSDDDDADISIHGRPPAAAGPTASSAKFTDSDIIVPDSSSEPEMEPKAEVRGGLGFRNVLSSALPRSSSPGQLSGERPGWQVPETETQTPADVPSFSLGLEDAGGGQEGSEKVPGSGQVGAGSESDDDNLLRFNINGQAGSGFDPVSAPLAPRKLKRLRRKSEPMHPRNGGMTPGAIPLTTFLAAAASRKVPQEDDIEVFSSQENCPTTPKKNLLKPPGPPSTAKSALTYASPASWHPTPSRIPRQMGTESPPDISRQLEDELAEDAEFTFWPGDNFVPAQPPDPPVLEPRQLSEAATRNFRAAGVSTSAAEVARLVQTRLPHFSFIDELAAGSGRGSDCQPVYIDYRNQFHGAERAGSFPEASPSSPIPRPLSPVGAQRRPAGRKQEKRNAAMADQSTAAVGGWRVEDGQKVYVNKKGKKLFGRIAYLESLRENPRYTKKKSKVNKSQPH